jgi:hypothetical protein
VSCDGLHQRFITAGRGSQTGGVSWWGGSLKKISSKVMKEFIRLDVSDRPSKKYVFIFRDDNKIKKIHFGSRNSQTYLNHHDKLKRNNYLKRHEALGENWDAINAGSLSAFLLWGDSTDLKTNLYNYLNHFSIFN